MTEMQASSVLDKVGAVKDVMTVSRAFGESYQVDGITIIPVATVRGGGGGRSDTRKDSPSGEEGRGIGARLGFGATVRPVGVVLIKDGKVSSQPTFDVMWVILGGQLLGLAAILAVRRLIERRVTGHPPLSSGE